MYDAIVSTASRRPLSSENSLLQAAIDSGKQLTPEQLRELVEFEASELGFSFEEARRRAKLGLLPKNALGSDVELLIQLLAA